MQAVEYHPLFLKGIAYFNLCYYFESHDAWEELWAEYQGPSRKFYQGLIQAAVALHHFGNGNIRGARKLFNSSTNYLTPYGPHHEGIDLEKFLAEMATCFAEVTATEEEYPKIDLNADLLPEISLDPPAANETPPLDELDEEDQESNEEEDV